MATLYWIVVLPAAAFTLWHMRRAHLGFGTCASWALLTLAHGLLFKPLFMQFEYPSRELIELTLLPKISFDEYWTWSVVALLPYIIFVVGMLSTGRYARRPQPGIERPQRVTRFDETVLAALALVALGGLVGFFIQFPQLLESTNKNTIATADIADYSSGGIWRALVELGFVVSLCALVNIGLGCKRRVNIALFGTTAVMWLTFCFMSDQRGLMMFAVITYLIAYGRYVAPVSRSVVVLTAAVLVLFIVGKTAMRLQTESSALQEDLAAVAANVIGQNLVENGKTITIIKMIPQQLDYQYGKTYLDAVLILVPREIFPAKTTVNLDTIIGNSIFDCDAFGACGVPPGLVAESYLNFGALGVLLLPALVGGLVGRVDRRFRTPRPGSVADLFFVYSLVFTGMGILGSGLSSVMTQVILQATEIGLVALVAGRPGVVSGGAGRAAGRSLAMRRPRGESAMGA